MELDFEWCYRAVTSRDGRFDGWFYTGVTTTGIYCRPSCPARTPRRDNVRFYRCPAGAQAAGFRACLRCRPDAVPGSPEWDIRADVVARAVRLIGEGVVDREGVSGLARRLGYTERHLHRMVSAELGAGPLALARAQRAQTARTLAESTDLGLAEIAFAAGFGSVRQFNDTVRLVYGVPPSALRDRRGPAPDTNGTIALRLAYRQPLHARSLLDFLGHRTVPGLDARHGDTYHRALRLAHGTASVALTPGQDWVTAQLRLSDLRDLPAVVARCRWLLDLDADPIAVDAALAADPVLAPLVAADPGVRAPRTTDGFEMAVRAVIGQQISVAGARTVLARLVAATADTADTTATAGTTAPVAAEVASTETEMAVAQGQPAVAPFPRPETILALPDDAFAMPARRRVTIQTLAAMVAAGDVELGPDADPVATRDGLRRVPGIGDWTADYLALRALGDPDVFLPTDLGARRGAAALRLPDDVARLGEHAAKHWAPWRSYALIRLWRHA